MQHSLSLLQPSRPLRLSTQLGAQQNRHHHHWPHGRPHKHAARQKRHLPLPDGQAATQEQLDLERCRLQMLQEASSYSEDRSQQHSQQPEASPVGLALVRTGFAIMLLPLIARPALRVILRPALRIIPLVAQPALRNFLRPAARAILRPAARIFSGRMLRIWAAALVGFLLKPRIGAATSSTSS